MTIYREIAANRARTWVLMVLFVIFVALLVQFVALVLGGDGWAGLIALVLSILYVVISYYVSPSVVLAISQAKLVKREEYFALYNTVENLCIASGLPMPKVYIIEDSAPNAFATGRDPQHASIAVTRGLLEKLQRLELEGVLAHEVSHIRNRDMQLDTMVVVLLGLVALISDLFLTFTWFGAGRRVANRGRGEGAGGAILLIFGLVALIIAPIVAQLIKLAISRNREYLADASAALLTRNPEGLARALERIGADKEPLEVANKATAHLYITNPLKGHESGLNNLFSTHPPTLERVKRLRAMV
jgi:heat shock protein HtpX